MTRPPSRARLQRRERRRQRREGVRARRLARAEGLRRDWVGWADRRVFLFRARGMAFTFTLAEDLELDGEGRLFRPAEEVEVSVSYPSTARSKETDDRSLVFGVEKEPEFPGQQRNSPSGKFCWC